MFLTYKKIIVEIKFRKYCVNSLVARVHLLNERTKSLFCLLVLKTILLVRFLEEFEDTKKSFRNQWMTNYSRVHISSDSLFSKILKKPSIVQKKWYLLWTSLVSFIAKEQKNIENWRSWKMTLLCFSYEVSFISALWMVSSESWKRLHPN